MVAAILSACDVVLPGPPIATPTPVKPPPPTADRTHLTIGLDEDLSGLGHWPRSSPTGTAAQALELWHSTLATLDERGNPVLRLAAALPSLDDGTWQVRPDGTMATT